MALHSATPAVSCILFPADGSSGSNEQLFISTSKDYTLGKLYRTGRDAVYAKSRRIDRKGRTQRVYDAGLARRGLATLDEHLSWFSATHDDWALRARQGHGNIGMNNWAVAYVITLADRLMAYREQIRQRPAYQRAAELNFSISAGA